MNDHSDLRDEAKEQWEAIFRHGAWVRRLQRERDEALEKAKTLSVSCNRMFGEGHILTEKYNRLRKAIEDAPHTPECQCNTEYRLPELTGPCDCWKREAVEVKG